MPAPHPPAIRRLAEKYFIEGKTDSEIALLLGIDRSCVVKWRARFNRTGSIETGKIGGHRRPILDGQEELVKRLVKKNPTWRLIDHVEHLAKLGFHVCIDTLWRFMRKLKLTHKKATRVATRRMDDDVQAHRRNWPHIIKGIPLENLVFIDETCVKDTMFPDYGWGPKGERVECVRPCGSWRNFTTIGALTLDGMKAMSTFKGAMNNERFHNYAANVLAPNLKEGDVVVMDNLRCHKYEPALDAIEATGARVLFLPAYSPDLNPIEPIWSPVKHWIRLFQPRTLEEIINVINWVVERIEFDTILGCFANSGYCST